jgi:hypothetical protein
MGGNSDFDVILGLLPGQDTQTAGWDLLTRESSLGYVIGLDIGGWGWPQRVPGP